MVIMANKINKKNVQLIVYPLISYRKAFIKVWRKVFFNSKVVNYLVLNFTVQHIIIFQVHAFVNFIQIKLL